jgi:catechol 2,3-dioxygenase-like lactoylglutathione lyase family enzyme
VSVPNPFPQPKTALDHAVIAVSEYERSNEFYRDVVGVTVVELGAGFAYRLGDVQFNVHGPGIEPDPVPVQRIVPGGSELCFRWDGTAEEAIAHLERKGVLVEDGPLSRPGARGEGSSVYFRDPDGSLLEFITYQEA